MSVPPDEIQPIEIGDDAPDPWDVNGGEPTTLIMFWPDDAMPMKTEIIAALQATLDLQNLTVDEPEDIADFTDEDDGGDVQWMFLPNLETVDKSFGLPDEIIVWCEPAHSGGGTDLDEAIVEQTKWIVGFETMLPHADPLTAFTALMRLIAAAFADLRAVLDINAMASYTRVQMQALFIDAEVEPPMHCLWTIHGVSETPVNEAATKHIWFHTHGLNRCGLPELEMLDVDGGVMTQAACEVINLVGSLMIDNAETPTPGSTIQIGPELQLNLQPWQEVSALLPEDVSGSMKDRMKMGGDHASVAGAVICDVEPAGQFRDVWVWPQSVLNKIRQDGTIVWRTRRETWRCTQLAHHTLVELATLSARLAQISDDILPHHVVVKAALGADGPVDVTKPLDDAIEHAWFSVKRWDAISFEGELLAKPVGGSTFDIGDELTVPFVAVSNWCVETPAGVFGPEDTGALWNLIDRVTEENADTEDNT